MLGPHSASSSAEILPEPRERHQPVASACDLVKQYPDSDIEHVCMLDHSGGDTHRCTCGLVWQHDTSREEIDELATELAQERVLTGERPVFDPEVGAEPHQPALGQRQTRRATAPTNIRAYRAAQLSRCISDLRTALNAPEDTEEADDGQNA